MRNKTLLPAVVIGLLLAFLIISFTYLGSTFLPVYIALVLAYVFDPAVDYLEKKGLGRSLSILTVFFAVFLLVASLTGFFLVSIRNEFQDVQINLPDYARRFYAWIPGQVKSYLGIETPEKVYLLIDAQLERLRDVSLDLYKETFSFVKKAFASTLAFILAIVGYFITPLYLYYFLKDMHRIEARVLELVPKKYRNPFIAKASEIHTLLSAFVQGQLLLIVILSVLYSIGLYFIGIDLAVAIGTLAGVTFVIPYLGTLIGIVLSVVMALLKFHDFLHPLLCLGWFGLVQLLEGSVITPKIVGDKVGLHPVVTILALLVGGHMMGIVGMLLAVPVTAVLKVFVRSLVEMYQRTEYYREG